MNYKNFFHTHQKKVLNKKDFYHLTIIIVLLIIFGLLGFWARSVGESFELFRKLFVALTTLYLTIVLNYLMIRSIKILLSSNKFMKLIKWYVIFTLAFITSIAFLHNAINEFELGHLYETSDEEKIATDIKDYMYFSAITHFSVGYGDIAPYGIHRFVSVYNAFIGHLFNLIIMAIAISNFMRNSQTQSTT